MSLIRNGGFERGNTDFWTVETDGTLEINDTDQKYGNYCGKYTVGSDVDPAVLNSDYIEVDPFDLINLLGWIKSSSVTGVWIAIYTYDADYSYIGTIKGMGRDMDGTYININTQIMIPEGVKYIRAGYMPQSGSGNILYFDGFSVNILNADKIITGYVNLIDIHNASGTADTLSDRKDLQMYKTFEADLIVSWAGGTSPTLDVTIYEKTSGIPPQIVGTFTQATGVTNERITLTHCTGKELYIGYVVGGTDTPKFDFTVDVLGKG